MMYVKKKKLVMTKSFKMSYTINIKPQSVRIEDL